MVTLRSLSIGKSVHLLPIYTPKYRLIFPGENKKKPQNMVGMHIYVQDKVRLPGWLMDRNSNFYSPKIIWGLCEDLPDSVGLVTVKSRGTIISYLPLLCITFFFQDQKYCMCGQHISKWIQQNKNKYQTKHQTKAKL